MDDCTPPTTVQQINDEEDLYRRLTVENWIIPMPNGSIRPSSAVYISRFDDISVDIASKTTPIESIRNALALIGISAREPKELGYPVVEDPILPENPAHALIKGRIRKSHARKLARASFWVIEPEKQSCL